MDLSLLTYIFLFGGKKQKTKKEELVFLSFSQVPHVCRRAWNFCFLLFFSGSSHSASFIPRKSSLYTPMAVLESTLVGKHTTSFEEEKIKFLGDSVQCRIFVKIPRDGSWRVVKSSRLERLCQAVKSRPSLMCIWVRALQTPPPAPRTSLSWGCPLHGSKATPLSKDWIRLWV